MSVGVCCQAVHYYTQALSEAGIHAQRAACAALSCLQVSTIKVQMHDNVESDRVKECV